MEEKAVIYPSYCLAREKIIIIEEAIFFSEAQWEKCLKIQGTKAKS